MNTAYLKSKQQIKVTGAGHGIGKELANKYRATVVCWDINEEINNETMNGIKNMGKNSVYAYREEVFRVAEKVKKEVGDVTILVNNAGIAFVKSFLNHSLDEIRRVIDVNVTAHYWASNGYYFQTLKAFLPSMIEKNYGHIVALSSVAGLVGAPYGTVYCPTKFTFMICMIKIVQLCVNLLWLTLQIFYYICQSVYHHCFGLHEKEVAGEIVLITGAGHGIGKELAIQYASLGAKVVCLDMNKHTNEETANQIGKNAYAYREEIFALAKKVKEEVGDVTILVNNAGLMDAIDNELRKTNKEKSQINFTTIYPYMVDTGLCKKPKINKMLEAFLLLSSPKDTASQIIKAQRQNIRRKSIPSFWLSLVAFARLFPENAQISVTDFIDSGVEPS
ncbi:Short-chain dehydrogenase/reductase family 16C member 6 [Temnothorax longispinosus]|uniref:Short-chain dehydrogenase/reductase family 16C member 6 n=1 Tax=Temnothorax longispinosus TaxID=300112 RepID=A0A4S2L540_9HYME|nr:Short-chain dehydrogenase/reductase family 16C member 6 [Temnothorax longispinosus]